MPTPVAGSCPGEDGWEAMGPNCYYFEPDEYKSWDDAQEACVRLAGRKCSLASIAGSSENWFVRQRLDILSNTPFKHGAWLGAVKMGLSE